MIDQSDFEVDVRLIFDFRQFCYCSKNRYQRKNLNTWKNELFNIRRDLKSTIFLDGSKKIVDFEFHKRKILILKHQKIHLE